MLTEEDEGGENTHPACVISFDLWQKEFGGAPDVLNNAILLNARPFMIVGATERGCHGAALQGRFDLQVPMSMTQFFEGEKRGSTGWSWLQAGVTRARAEGNIDGIGRNIDQEQGHEKWRASYPLFPG